MKFDKYGPYMDFLKQSETFLQLAYIQWARLSLVKMEIIRIYLSRNDNQDKRPV